MSNRGGYCVRATAGQTDVQTNHQTDYLPSTRFLPSRALMRTKPVSASSSAAWSSLQRGSGGAGRFDRAGLGARGLAAFAGSVGATGAGGEASAVVGVRVGREAGPGPGVDLLAARAGGVGPTTALSAIAASSVFRSMRVKVCDVGPSPDSAAEASVGRGGTPRRRLVGASDDASASAASGSQDVATVSAVAVALAAGSSRDRARAGPQVASPAAFAEVAEVAEVRVAGRRSPDPPVEPVVGPWPTGALIAARAAITAAASANG